MFSIIDNGQGFDTTRQGYLGVGLLSMQERMKALGGDVQVVSTPGKGTRVVAYCNRLGVDTTMAGDEEEVTKSGKLAQYLQRRSMKYVLENNGAGYVFGKPSMADKSAVGAINRPLQIFWGTGLFRLANSKVRGIYGRHHFYIDY